MIKPLTSWRFIAALAVFLSHLSFLGNFSETKRVFDNVFYEGYLGVTFFFILSGFILTYNYHDKFNEIDKQKLLQFLKARLARIYPVYLLTFSISLPLAIVILLDKPLVYSIVGLLNLSMLQSFIPVSGVYFSYNGPSWSISDEMFFYILFPFVIYFFVKKLQKIISKKVIVSSAIVFVMAISIVWVLRDNSLAHWLFYISPMFRFLDFLLGVLLCLWFIRSKQANKQTSKQANKQTSKQACYDMDGDISYKFDCHIFSYAFLRTPNT